jgi:16S rRNA (adenine1518-N6/adenine1519-N6)-dimethyltransferase
MQRFFELAAERTGLHPVSREVFRPRPNVDSALVAFRRRPDAELGDDWEWTSHVVHAAFAHRRKTLANALSLAELPPPPAEIAGLRAEQLQPEQLAVLARELR